MNGSEYYTLQEVCARLDVSRRTVYRWSERGRFRKFKAVRGGRIMFLKTEIDALAEDWIQEDD